MHELHSDTIATPGTGTVGNGIAGAHGGSRGKPSDCIKWGKPAAGSMHRDRTQTCSLIPELHTDLTHSASSLGP